ncbi:carboxylesterase/lipase family protein [Microbulbifer sediminum]|uniref:carboxylesterase/lipase family protein n=1 Tax=Microbulbifer sediminum TaxID=2904250 RepID=UPI001F204356|nr:carboxylesterase/lipase family protein [Microbulbifer sediminum]
MTGKKQSGCTRAGGSGNNRIIDTPAGPILGQVDVDSGVTLFLGIPYALPPIGDLRWRPPEPFPRWQSPLAAYCFGMPAPQNPSTLMEILGPGGEPPESEDCLYLNIYASIQACTNKLPVMIWIHGGSFYMGSGCQPVYNGRHLAASGRAIVVTLNYRLGSLGFLRLAECSDVEASGNEGVQDQIAAIRWVQTNITAFGGDPDNITLFGESAGAMSITALMAIPHCKGLFHRAVIQSGSPCAIQDRDRANSLAEAFVGKLQCNSGVSPAAATTRQLLQAQREILADPRLEREWGQLPFKPVLDGELLTVTPIEAVRQGHATEVPLLVGSNLEEWNLFSVSDPGSFTLDRARIVSHLNWLLPEPELNDLLDHYYSRARTLEASPWPEWSRAWNLMLTDMIFTVPGLRLLEAHAGKRYHYHFAQPLAAQPLLGACHAVELGYVFGTHGEESLHDLYGGEQDADALSCAVREAWLNFAETGDPGPEWPAFTEGHSRRFGEHPEAHTFDRATVTRIWQDIGDDLIGRYL